jgi:hypothetical protein
VPMCGSRKMPSTSAVVAHDRVSTSASSAARRGAAVTILEPCELCLSLTRRAGLHRWREDAIVQASATVAVAIERDVGGELGLAMLALEPRQLRVGRRDHRGAGRPYGRSRPPGQRAGRLADLLRRRHGRAVCGRG